VAIISAGKDNSYGHPHEEALQRLSKHTDIVYGTWESGTVKVKTNGETYFVYADTSISVEVPEEVNETGNNDIEIVSIDLADETVTIKNNSSKDIDMTDWQLVSVEGNQTFDFPAGYNLQAGATVKVVSGRGANGMVVTFGIMKVIPESWLIVVGR